MQDKETDIVVDRRQFVRLLSGGALTATIGGLVGCGGGNGGAGGSGGGGTGGLGLGTLTPQATAAVMEATRGFVAALPALDLAPTQQRVLEFVQSRKEFVHSGTNAGSVWGLLPSGMTYTIFLNRYPQAGENIGPDSGRSAAARGAEVPSGTLAAVMLNSMGPGFRNEPALLSASVNEKQYVIRGGAASIESLRSLGAPAFFYLSAHGDQTAVPRIQNGKFVLGADRLPIMDKAFAVSTTTPYDEAAKQQYLAEILRGEVGAGVCQEDIQGGRAINANRLLITSRWVARNWTFSKDSLIWISACSSNGAISQDFVSACLTKAGNAALYVGFSDFTEGDHAVQVSKFVIDRLLGTNKLSPVEDPPQRPFDFVQVYADLRKRGLHSRPTLNPATGAAFAGRTTEVIFTQGSTSQFGLLAPSLAYVLVDEINDQAILKGIFGTPQPSDRAVLIGGLEATVQSWDKDKIVVSLPRTGPGSAGDVVVSVRAHQSNKRMISRWTLQGKYHAQPQADEPFQIDGTVTMVFRADVGEYRKDPGNVFVRPTRYAIATRDSAADLEAKGILRESCGDGNFSTKSWTGHGNWPSLMGTAGGGQTPQARGIAMWLSFDSINKTGALAFAFGLKSPDDTTFRFIDTGCDGHTVDTPLPPFPPATAPVDMKSPTEEIDTVFPVPGKTFGAINGWDIPAFRMSSEEINTYIDWNAATAEFPPDPVAARSAQDTNREQNARLPVVQGPRSGNGKSRDVPHFR